MIGNQKQRSARVRAGALIFSLGLMAVAVVTARSRAAGLASDGREEKLERINHFVVIYQENHSFDNLFGGWEGVEGLSEADAARALQVNQVGAVYDCLAQNDPSLTSPPLQGTCSDPANGITSAFVNAPFNIDQDIPATATTCPNGVPGGDPGGCTRDLVHRFYQEQYQLHGGPPAICPSTGTCMPQGIRTMPSQIISFRRRSAARS